MKRQTETSLEVVENHITDNLIFFEVILSNKFNNWRRCGCNFEEKSRQVFMFIKTLKHQHRFTLASRLRLLF